MCFNFITSLVMLHCISLSFLRWPLWLGDITNPASYGIANAKNVRIEVGENQYVAAWIIAPTKSPIRDRDVTLSSQTKNRHECGDESCDASDLRKAEDAAPTCSTEDPLLPLLPGPEDVAFLYLHGNTDTRRMGHRRKLYKLLQAAGFYVLAVDYRGYADSSPVTVSESTMVADAEAAFQWLRAHSHPAARIMVYSHSLGTGVATKMGANLAQRDVRPHGYVLTTPFNRIRDEVESLWIGRVVGKFLDLSRILQGIDCEFDSEKWIQKITDPILIIHSKSDYVVPYKLALRLYLEAKNHCDVQMISYEPEANLGHNNLVEAENHTDVISKFVHHCLQRR